MEIPKNRERYVSRNFWLTFTYKTRGKREKNVRLKSKNEKKNEGEEMLKCSFRFVDVPSREWNTRWSKESNQKWLLSSTHYSSAPLIDSTFLVERM